jgi:hypothetical protein
LVRALNFGDRALRDKQRAWSYLRAHPDAHELPTPQNVSGIQKERRNPL